MNGCEHSGSPARGPAFRRISLSRTRLLTAKSADRPMTRHSRGRLAPARHPFCDPGNGLSFSCCWSANIGITPRRSPRLSLVSSNSAQIRRFRRIQGSRRGSHSLVSVKQHKVTKRDRRESSSSLASRHRTTRLELRMVFSRFVEQAMRHKAPVGSPVEEVSAVLLAAWFADLMAADTHHV